MSELKCTHSCSDCSRLGCRSASEEQYPPFCLTTNVDKALLEETLEIYRSDPEQGLIARTSACIEGEFYGRLTRVEETIEFIKRMGYKKIGIASCVGLMRETSIFARILKAKGIEYFTVGCKVGAQDKTEIGVPNEKKLNGGCGHESMLSARWTTARLISASRKVVLVMPAVSDTPVAPMNALLIRMEDSASIADRPTNESVVGL